jgi:UDP-glucose 4-epimerase
MSRGKIMVTGGCGYIGSHTVISLCEAGYEVISVDNFSNSFSAATRGIEAVTGKSFKNYDVDACDYAKLKMVFDQNPDLTGVIHFAAFKAVGESVEKPLKYFYNNIGSLLNILKCTIEANIKNFVFSSSCTVYGAADDLPIRETSPLKPTQSTYGSTKQMGEQIIREIAASNPVTKFIILRYFNPAGAHHSARIGEFPIGKPLNIVPVITQFAIGLLPNLYVYGNDYDTRDGTCIRDYVHVMDVADAHTLSLEYLMKQKNTSSFEIFNLGSGNGVTVLELINAFEKANGVKLDYTIAPRRPGDVPAIYADCSKAIEKLGWLAKRDIYEMMRSAWEWQKYISGKVPAGAVVK